MQSENEKVRSFARVATLPASIRLREMPIELQVDPAALVDVWCHPSLFPAGTEVGDIIAIRPANIVGKGKRRDQPLLFKVPELDATAKEGRKVVQVNSHCASNFHWIDSRRVEVTLDLVRCVSLVI